MTSSPQRRAVTLAALVFMPVLCLTPACSSDTPTEPAAAPSPPAAPAPSATSQEPLDLKKAATIRVGAHEVTVIASSYQQPLRAQFPPRRSGYEYAGLEVRVCVDRGPGPMGVSWDGWMLTYVDSTSVEPLNAWSDDWFSVPLFPGSGFEKRVRVGRCVKGWVVFEAPKGERPDLAEYLPEDGPADGPTWNL